MARHKTIRAVRGEGLLVGMELDGNAGEIVVEAMKKGFILNAIQGKVIRFAPPLVVTREEIDAVVNALDDLIE
jgi:acetylornithine/succinyldiaminopimelate/putrescine aminotransferase